MGGKVESFEELKCWQEARALVKMIYQLTIKTPFSKDFCLSDQIHRSAISVMANIAEGFGTFSDQEFIRFLGFAYRSCLEVRSHLYIAVDVGYIKQDIFARVSEQARKCENYIKAFIRYLRNKITVSVDCDTLAH